jgi:hypothetical protein
VVVSLCDSVFRLWPHACQYSDRAETYAVSRRPLIEEVRARFQDTSWILWRTRVALGEGVFLRYLMSSLVIVIPPVIRTHSLPMLYNLSNWHRHVTHLRIVTGLVRYFQGRVGVQNIEEQIWKVCIIF